MNRSLARQRQTHLKRAEASQLWPPRPFKTPVPLRLLSALLLTALCGIVVLEALLLARIAIQASAAQVSGGLNHSIFQATDYLMQPFQAIGARDALVRDTGIIEYDAVLAAEVYLVVGLVIAALFIVVKLLGSRRARPRGSIWG